MHCASSPADQPIVQISFSIAFSDRNLSNTQTRYTKTITGLELLRAVEMFHQFYNILSGQITWLYINHKNIHADVPRCEATF